MLTAILGTIFSGGATGIIGVIAQRYADYKNRQLDMQLEAQRHANNVALRELDSRIMAQESAAKVEIVNLEGDNANALQELKNKGTEIQGDVMAFKESYALEPKLYNSGKLTVGQNWVMVLLDVFRGSVRPLLTVYLCVLTTYIYFQARGLLNQEDLDTDQALKLTEYVVHSILYLTTTIVLWWFGTRNKSKE